MKLARTAAATQLQQRNSHHRLLHLFMMHKQMQRTLHASISVCQHQPQQPPRLPNQPKVQRLGQVSLPCRRFRSSSSCAQVQVWPIWSNIQPSMQTTWSNWSSIETGMQTTWSNWSNVQTGMQVTWSNWSNCQPDSQRSSNHVVRLTVSPYEQSHESILILARKSVQWQAHNVSQSRTQKSCPI
jgi:hypothetical protein